MTPVSCGVCNSPDDLRYRVGEVAVCGSCRDDLLDSDYPYKQAIREVETTGADLTGADLYEADLTRADLFLAKADKWTRWPDGFNPKTAGVGGGDVTTDTRWPVWEKTGAIDMFLTRDDIIPQVLWDHREPDALAERLRRQIDAAEREAKQ